MADNTKSEANASLLGYSKDRKLGSMFISADLFFYVHGGFVYQF